ncbi:hypothetical protein [Cytobacillus firmus]|uniref:Cap15 family cyclic dinucleotide receptor domain-containing protein n=1 Tax=Cytobacillus firmus TaxID=1399 RepID=UPI001C8EA569|nr:hypothetical protein [Cytobacillus firmus]MBX9976398.1 hypothetical protein [Cytobacillus firmus]
MHEYTVVDHPRRIILFGLAIISTFISGYISSYINIWAGITIPLSSMTIFTGLYLLLNHLLWKLKIFRKIFSFPNLDGEWECTGLSKNILLQKETDWEGTIIIKQTWDKVLITLKTNNSQSKSVSITGGIKYFAGDGYKLSYHYENTPNPTAETDMRKHEGFCVLTFGEEEQTAEGYYFNNNKDRQSFGEMYLIRRGKNGKKQLSEETRIA